MDGNSAEAARHQAAKISECSDYAEVLSCYMEEDPLVSEWPTLTSSPYVVVIPFFISDGLHSYQDIPVLLGIDQEQGLRQVTPESLRKIRITSMEGISTMVVPSERIPGWSR